MSITIDDKGFIRDTESGLIVPERMGRMGASPHPLNPRDRAKFVQTGVVLKRDEKTGIVMTPGYGTRFDDYMMRAIVGGYIQNVGISPLIDPQFSTLVAKRQAMASTWQLLLSGRKSPTKRFAEVISRAQDSDYGAGEFVKSYIGALDVDNAGAFFSVIPLETSSFDAWESMGITAVPIEKVKENSKDDRFYLPAGTEPSRENQGLWMIDGLNCSPTGDPEWPYWIRKWSDDLNRHVWVLVNRRFGGQIIQQVGPRNISTLGFGQSGSWRYLKMVLHEVLILEMDIEALMNQPPRGIVWGTGLDTPDQLRNQLTQFKEERDEDEILLYPGVLFGGSKSDKAQIMLVKWTEPPAGYTPATWKAEKEDVLASCFHMSVAQIVTRLGEGAFTQSRVTDDIQAETGIAWMRDQIEMVFNHFAPPRVLVTANWISDRAKRYQIESFEILARGIETIQRSTEGGGLSIAEIRQLMQQFGSIPIPETESPVTDDTEDSNQIDTTELEKQARKILTAGKRPLKALERIFPRTITRKLGNLVECRGITGRISGWNGNVLEIFTDLHARAVLHSPLLAKPHELNIVRLAVEPFVPESTTIPEMPTTSEPEDAVDDALGFVAESLGDEWKEAVE